MHGEIHVVFYITFPSFTQQQISPPRQILLSPEDGPSTVHLLLAVATCFVVHLNAAKFLNPLCQMVNPNSKEIICNGCWFESRDGFGKRRTGSCTTLLLYNSRITSFDSIQISTASGLSKAMRKRKPSGGKRSLVALISRIAFAWSLRLPLVDTRSFISARQGWTQQTVLEVQGTGLSQPFLKSSNSSHSRRPIGFRYDATSPQTKTQ